MRAINDARGDAIEAYTTAEFELGRAGQSSVIGISRAEVEHLAETIKEALSDE